MKRQFNIIETEIQQRRAAKTLMNLIKAAEKKENLNRELLL